MVNSDHKNSDAKISFNSIKTAIQKRFSKETEDINDKKPENTALIPSKERLESAVKKLNASNEQRIVATSNYFAELDNDYQLLQEYVAFRNPNLENLSFQVISPDTVSAVCGRKQVEIKCTTPNNETKLHEINFADGSQLRYVSYLKDGKMEINGEEYEIPSGTLVETKSVQGKVISKLIQIPGMQRVFIDQPNIFEKVEQALTTYNPKPEVSPVMPTIEYVQKLLGNANSVQPLLYLAKGTYSDSNRTDENEITYLKQKIAEGRLPESTKITGVKGDGGKILTIQGQNCRYEVCGSEMRVLDNNNEIKMLARYISSRNSLGLWILLYDNGKPISGQHYTAGSLDEPKSKVVFTYNYDNTVTATLNDSYGTKRIMVQIPDESLCFDIDGEFKFVPSSARHLGEAFENQKPF